MRPGSHIISAEFLLDVCQQSAQTALVRTAQMLFLVAKDQWWTHLSDLELDLNDNQIFDHISHNCQILSTAIKCRLALRHYQ